MRVIAVRCGQPAIVTEIGEELEDIQEFVGGYFEQVYLGESCVLICNEEGIILGLPLNVIIAGIGSIHGDFFICNMEGEEYVSISPSNEQKWLKYFNS